MTSRDLVSGGPAETPLWVRRRPGYQRKVPADAVDVEDRASRAPADLLTAAPAALLALQASAGNDAVQRLLFRRQDRAQSAARASAGGAAVQRATKRKAAFNPPQYVMDPSWGAFGNLPGGRFMKVRLGPLAFDPTARGSTPGQAACTAVNRLNAVRYGGYKWIKGHLLNENLGGPGISQNLTPLTHNANEDHLHSIESAVKAAITWSKSRADYHRADDWWFGVYYEVKVVGSTWSGGGRPAYARVVGEHLECRAVWIKQEKTDPANVVPFDGTEPAHPALPAVQPVPVDCVQ